MWIDAPVRYLLFVEIRDCREKLLHDRRYFSLLKGFVLENLSEQLTTEFADQVQALRIFECLKTRGDVGVTQALEDTCFTVELAGCRVSGGFRFAVHFD